VLTDDPNTHTLNDKTYTPIDQEQDPGPPELRVTKSAILAVDADNNTVVSPGDTLQYIVAINNNGGSAADNVTFTDTVDPNTSLILGSVTTSQGTVTSQTLTGLTVNVGTLEAGPTHSICLITFRVIIKDPFPLNTDNVTNQGWVTADNIIDPIPTDDPNTDTSPDPTVTQVPLSDLVITKTASPNPVLSGGTLTYTLTVTNYGPTTAPAVTVTDILPVGLSFVSADNGTNNSGTVTWNLGAMAKGESVVLTLVTTVSLDATDTIINMAAISGVRTDPELDNNTANEQTLVANIAIDKTGTYMDTNGSGKQDAGDNITYTFTVTNTGTTPLNDVTVSDPTIAVIGDPIALAPGENTTFTAIYTITQMDIDNGTYTNTASVNGKYPDNNDITDTDSDTQNFIQTPSIKVSKVANPLTYHRVGDLITFTVSVQNTGNVTLDLADTDITDVQIGLTYVSGDINSNQKLDVGETWNYAGTYTITQSDLNAGSVTNSATAIAHFVEESFSDSGVGTANSDRVQGVGGEVRAVNKMQILAPWLFLIIASIVGGGILIICRRKRIYW
jgi:uncharacterized repeat protein (TIGR01451 family)